MTSKTAIREVSPCGSVAAAWIYALRPFISSAALGTVQVKRPFTSGYQHSERSWRPAVLACYDNVRARSGKRGRGHGQHPHAMRERQIQIPAAYHDRPGER